MLRDIIGYRRLEEFGKYLLTAEKYRVANIHPTEIEIITLFKYQEIPPPYLYWVFWFLPFAFPEYWEGNNLKPQLRGRSLHLKEAVMTFFSLSTDEFNHLFVPYQQNTFLYKGVELNLGSEPLEVGFNILSFLKTIVLKN